MEWSVGDWVVFDLKVGQIKELRESGAASFSDGWCETSGHLRERFRPLTLENKRTAEYFETVYERLRQIDGEAGFNYPDISRHFCDLALAAIDASAPEEARKFCDEAQAFVSFARDYVPVIQGVRLFRRAA